MGAYRAKLSDGSRIYSDNDDILKRSDCNQEPVRSKSYSDTRRQEFELGSARLRCGIERLFLQFEIDHKLQPGEAMQLMLNTGMNRLGCQR